MHHNSASIFNSTEFYQSICARSSLGLAVYDPSGQCVEANETIGRILGLSREQLMAQNYHHLKTWKEQGMLDTALSVMTDKRDEHHTMSTTTSSGRTVTLACHLIPFDWRGKSYLILTVHDITERKKVEDSLRISEENMQLALDGADLGFWSWEVKTGTTYFSPRYFTMLGYDPDELPHTFDTWDSLLHPDDRQKAKDEVTRCIKEKIGWEVEFRLRTKGGDYCWILGRGRVLEYDMQGNPLRSAGTHLDITERKMAEEVLLAEKNKLDAVMAALGDGITVQDRNYTVLYQNAVHKKIQGDHRGEKCYMAYQNKNDVCPECLVARTFADGQLHRRETEARGKDGRTLYLEVSASPILNAQGEITAVVEAVRDITDQKLMENEIQKAQKLDSLGVLAGGIAHDFNNLLTAILSNIQLSKMYSDPGQKSYERLETAEKALAKAVTLTKQLLTFSRGGSPVKRTILLEGIIKDAALLALSGSNVKCEFTIADNLWSVEVDEGQISQVINNLVVNAAQAMPEGGIITIDADNIVFGSDSSVPLPGGRYLRITVTDHGIGIAKKHLKQIFDPYFTLKQKGTGLGLAVSYSIIKNHAGHIEVASQPGKGTTFTLYLAASQKSGAYDRALEQELIPGEGRILVMDDDEMVRNSIGEILTTLGYDVDYAENGSEVLEKYKNAITASTRFDAVIMDLTVPGAMGGRGAMNALIAIDPDVKAIVSSGYSNDPVMANFSDYGFADALPKPYTDKKLSQILHKLLV